MKTTDLNQSEKSKKMCLLQPLLQPNVYNGINLEDMD